MEFPRDARAFRELRLTTGIKQIAGGNRNRDIGEKLFISEETVTVTKLLRIAKLMSSDCEATPGRHGLQRIFSTFPSGWPGAGLLLLRVAVGVAFAAQGIAYLVGWDDLGPVNWGVSLIEVASGISLLIGYLTPFAGILAGVTCVGGALSWFQLPSPNFFEAKVAAALATTITVAIACLGPGAFSIDAHLFGRREIIIPDASR